MAARAIFHEAKNRGRHYWTLQQPNWKRCIWIRLDKVGTKDSAHGWVGQLSKPPVMKVLLKESRRQKHA